MAKTLEKLPEELAAQPPFVAGGRQFQMYFIGVREPKLPTEHHLVVNFGAKNDSESLQGQLGLTPGQYDSPEVAQLAVSTMKAIIEGRLPPGAKDLL